MINDENVFAPDNRKGFGTPIKAGVTMTWNSPYHTITKESQKCSEDFNDQPTTQTFTAEDLLFNVNETDRSDFLSRDHHYHHNAPCFNTDIPVLDDLFSELNSDLPYNFNNNNNNTDFVNNVNVNVNNCNRNNSNNFNINNNNKFQSEPIDFFDIERILLQPTTASNTQSQTFTSKRSHVKQSFSSRLASIPSSSSLNILDPSLLDENDPFYDPSPNPMLWDGSTSSVSGSLPGAPQAPQTQTSNLILLQDAAAANTQNGKLQLKVIGVNSSNVSKKKTKLDSCGPSTSGSTHIIKPYILANQESTKKGPNQTYRTYGKKRQVIGKEYADFVSRLQHDIPFDSSEDEEDEEYKIRDLDLEERHRLSNNRQSESNDEYSSTSSSDEEECKPNTKISSQELLELFEDQCSGLPGIISAYLTHRKHQIALKGYKPRNNAKLEPSNSTNANSSSQQTSSSNSNASTVPLLSQNQFVTLKSQISRHFQFLIQNLALSNEIENCEGITLINLKLLVQLHLHLDSTCKLLINSSSSSTGASSTSSQNQSISGNISVAATSTTTNQINKISCLNAAPTLKINPVRSALIELIPAGISKVSIIAGFLARPGQKQFLSLSALRNDPTLKPKSSPLPPTSCRIKVHLQLSHQQFLSNSFYNIIALFHDYIDAGVLESTVNAVNLGKFLELPPSDPTLLLLPDYSYTNTNNNNNNNNNANNNGKTAKFSVAEDNLLLCGLHRFGCGNWESIQAQYLPSRTARQLAIRYKNLSSRREPMNPVKEFNERLMMPLNEIEEDLLYKGVQRFGNQFHLISKHYLPHRPATVLGKLWKAMDEARRTS